MRDLAPFIDHTILKPDASEAQVLSFCREALQFGFASVCVNSGHAEIVARTLAGSAIRTCVVVGFPLGATTSAVKVGETAGAVADGAGEIDMVLAIGALKEGRLDYVRADIAAVRAACPGILKVIVETCLLTDEEKRTACRLSQEAGADFVKTSTGFSTSGATVEDVGLMRAAVGDGMGVKASGGIRTREAALAMIAAGANRIGTSAGVALVTATPASSSTY